MKKNILTYFCVYSLFALMLIIPLLTSKNQIVWTSNFDTTNENQTKIELVCDDVVVGVISSYPGEKISYPSQIESNLSNGANIKVEGWYLDEALTDKFTFDTQPDSDTILYAKTNEEKAQSNFTFHLFWVLSIGGALGLALLFIIINRYYSKKRDV